MATIGIPSNEKSEGSKVAGSNFGRANGLVGQIKALIEPILRHPRQDIDRHPAATGLGICAGRNPNYTGGSFGVQIVGRHNVPQHKIVIRYIGMIVRNDLVGFVS